MFMPNFVEIGPQTPEIATWPSLALYYINIWNSLTSRTSLTWCPGPGEIINQSNLDQLEAYLNNDAKLWQCFSLLSVPMNESIWPKHSSTAECIDWLALSTNGLLQNNLNKFYENCIIYQSPLPPWVEVLFLHQSLAVQIYRSRWRPSFVLIPTSLEMRLAETSSCSGTKWTFGQQMILTTGENKILVPSKINSEANRWKCLDTWD